MQPADAAKIYLISRSLAKQKGVLSHSERLPSRHELLIDVEPLKQRRNVRATGTNWHGTKDIFGLLGTRTVSTTNRALTDFCQIFLLKKCKQKS
jgi:hypothetical protein